MKRGLKLAALWVLGTLALVGVSLMLGVVAGLYLV